jgi:hypothetical protein
VVARFEDSSCGLLRCDVVDTDVSEGDAEDGGSKFRRNFGILPHHYRVSKPTRPRHESSVAVKTFVCFLSLKYISS